MIPGSDSTLETISGTNSGKYKWIALDQLRLSKRAAYPGNIPLPAGTFWS